MEPETKVEQTNVQSTQEPVVETKPAVEQVEQVQQTQQTVEPVIEKSLIEKVAAFKPEQTQKEEPTTFTKFDVKKIEAIEDPTVRSNMWAAYHQMQSDYTRKTQEIAELRKGNQQPETTVWNTEKVQQLLKDHNFVQAAQQIAQAEASNDSSEESYLSETDKQLILQVKQQNQKLQEQMVLQDKQKQDTDLKAKYPDYAPDVVDVTIQKLVNNEIQATREDIWRLKNFEPMIERAYKMGLQDRQANNLEKADAISVQGNTITNSNSLELDSKRPFQETWAKIMNKNLTAKNTMKT